MKTRIFKVTVLAVFAFITGVNVYKAQTEVQLSETQLKNVEALASGEYMGSLVQWTNSGWVCFEYVYDDLGDDYFTCTDCETCSVLSATAVKGSGYCRLTDDL